MTFATDMQAALTVLTNNTAKLIDGIVQVANINEENKTSIIRMNADANSIYTRVEYRRSDNTLYKLSVLSGGTSPAYTTETVTYYAADGTTAVKTLTYALTYVNGLLERQTLQ